MPSKPVKTPWGRWEVIGKGAGYKVKRITVKPGQRLSLQRHEKRREVWVVVGGVGVMTMGNAGGMMFEYRMAKGDSAKIAPNIVHRIENIGDDPLVLVEVQEGECDERDIVRIQDDYGRK